MNLYKVIGTRIRTKRISTACAQLRAGQDVDDCGKENIVFHPTGVTGMKRKPGIFSGFILGKREPFSCKYSDLTVEHSGDPLFPDSVVIKIRGEPTADMFFEKQHDVISPYLVQPIVSMMKELERGPGDKSGSSKNNKSPTERINAITDLLNSGYISKQEYDEKRQAILDSI